MKGLQNNLTDISDTELTIKPPKMLEKLFSTEDSVVFEEESDETCLSEEQKIFQWFEDRNIKMGYPQSIQEDYMSHQK